MRELRDEIAMAVLQGMYAHHGADCPSYDKWAHWAYDQANAMLKARTIRVPTLTAENAELRAKLVKAAGMAVGAITSEDLLLNEAAKLLDENATLRAELKSALARVAELETTLSGLTWTPTPTEEAKQ